ncbi:MAG: hypothetical protein M1830_008374 [Pleopsidium flavum]|nr:MAG: hypothetical protein M1830_008374 [Pleopsidium flavum]
MVERAKKPSAIPVSPNAPSPQVEISPDNSRVTATLPTGESVQILLYGATVISWKSAGGKENLFLSEKAHLDGSKAVRGGIPVVFPVFGPPPSKHATSNLPQHGFARTSRWEYLGKSSTESNNSTSDDGVKLDFGLSTAMLSGEAKNAWPYSFGLTYSVTLSKEGLETTMNVRNQGEESFEFQVLLHSYLHVQEISEVTISGLKGAAYIDKTQNASQYTESSSEVTIASETDRVYKSLEPKDAITVVEKGKLRFEIVRDTLADVVVWNPWSEKAKGMSDFGPEDGYKQMTICINNTVKILIDCAFFTEVCATLMRSTSPFLENDVSRNSLTVTRKGSRPKRSDHVSSSGSIGLQNLAEPGTSQSPGPHNVREEGEGKSGFDDDGEDGTRQGGQEKPRKTYLSGMLPRLSTVGRHTSFIEEDEAQPERPSPEKEKLVSWKDLPNKGQLAILTMARLSEPLTQTSLQAYMFYQLKSFDTSLSDSTISSQAGLLQGSFTAAQFVTAILWGRIADADWGGRKKVLLIGLFGTCLSCVGFGFSRSFIQAVIFRTLGGALNGNVGVMRTMIAEIIKEKKFQSRAFLLMPMCFNIGVIIGPVLGGILADPVGSYPGLFGENSIFGGKQGVWWMKHWPYALPNLLSAFFLFTAATGVIFGLEETLESRKDKPDLGLHIGRQLASLLRRLFRSHSHKYTAVSADDTLDFSSDDLQRSTEMYVLEQVVRTKSTHHATQLPPPKPKRKLSIHRIWTRNVLFTLLTHGILAFHVGTFSNLWFIFLSTPRFDPDHPSPANHHRHLPFIFTGGLGMPPRSVGMAMAVLGVIGITLQLLVYPIVNQKLGTLLSYRLFLLCFPLAYALAPYLSIVPSSVPPPAQASGVLVWMALGGVLFIQVLARTFALPATIILINNCSPHPSVLGTIHGIGQSVSSASRTVGPVLGGWLYGLGLSHGVVGGVWWGLGAVAVCGWVASGWVYEGSGHEIFLEGEDDVEGEGKLQEPSSRSSRITSDEDDERTRTHR